MKPSNSYKLFDTQLTFGTTKDDYIYFLMRRIKYYKYQVTFVYDIFIKTNLSYFQKNVLVMVQIKLE